MACQKASKVENSLLAMVVLGGLRDVFIIERDVRVNLIRGLVNPGS